MGIDEIDALREELVKAQKEKLRIQRKSQVDLTKLLEKMKGIQEEPQEKIEGLEEQVEDLHAIVNEMQKEVKQLTQENSDLNRENSNLRQQLEDKRRDSIDETAHDRTKRGHKSAMSMLIEETFDAEQLVQDRGLQSEDQFEEERLEFTRNDSNITKDKHYVAWKNKALTAREEALAAKEEIGQLQQQRRETVAEVHSLKAKVVELESSSTSKISAYESQMENAKNQINKFKKKHEESERIRRDSISTLHENLFSKLLEAEAEHEEMVGDYKQRIQDLMTQSQQLQTVINSMGLQKVDTVIVLESTIQQLRADMSALSKQNAQLVARLNELESRTAVQNITASFSSWMG